MHPNSSPVADLEIDLPLNPTGRFALYFAPDPSTTLWAIGSAWLGHDAALGEPRPPPAVEGLSLSRWRTITETASRYGFHATLKPPFRLAAAAHVAALDASLASFAADWMPISLPRLRIADLNGFLAIQVTEEHVAVRTLADTCVRTFDAFRAPPSAEERARRQRAVLTERQRALLDEWGYPYVFEEWRFHMTLTCRLDEAERPRLQDILQDVFASALAEPSELDALCLFHQEAHDAPFRILRRYRLGRPTSDGR